ncbi:DUF6221 family protein [Streptomyces asoensis]|uniref:DUF6221 family protein n=1 Tax=Streptomyces asoensis TaxID=249586 RepID=UPI00340BFFD7
MGGACRGRSSPRGSPVSTSHQHTSRSTVTAPSASSARSPANFQLSGFHPTIALHVALHDPARVLREVAVKRRVLARHALGPATGDPELPWDNRNDGQYDGDTWACDDLFDLASPYGDHPGYPRLP